jgi:hypothetical protein
LKIAGILLMLAGWFLLPAAVVMLPTLPARTAFVLAGIGVEVLGFLFVARAHLPLRRKKA